MIDVGGDGGTTPQKKICRELLSRDRSALKPEYVGSEWVLLKQRACGVPARLTFPLGRGRLGSLLPRHGEKPNCKCMRDSVADRDGAAT